MRRSDVCLRCRRTTSSSAPTDCTPASGPSCSGRSRSSCAISAGSALSSGAQPARPEQLDARLSQVQRDLAQCPRQPGRHDTIVFGTRADYDYRDTAGQKPNAAKLSHVGWRVPWLLEQLDGADDFASTRRVQVEWTPGPAGRIGAARRRFVRELRQEHEPRGRWRLHPGRRAGGRGGDHRAAFTAYGAACGPGLRPTRKWAATTSNGSRPTTGSSCGCRTRYSARCLPARQEAHAARNVQVINRIELQVRRTTVGADPTPVGVAVSAVPSPELLDRVGECNARVVSRRRRMRAGRAGSRRRPPVPSRPREGPRRSRGGNCTGISESLVPCSTKNGGASGCTSEIGEASLFVCSLPVNGNLDDDPLQGIDELARPLPVQLNQS